MRAAVELPDSDVLVCVFEHSAAIAVDVQIVWSREDGNHRGEFLCWCLPMHRIPISRASSSTVVRKKKSLKRNDSPRILGFMSSNDTKQSVALKELARRLVSKEHSK